MVTLMRALLMPAVVLSLSLSCSAQTGLPDVDDASLDAGGGAPLGGAGAGGDGAAAGGGVGGVDAGAGGAVVTAAPKFVGGSRLRPRVRLGDDGSREQLGWHDTQLGTDCEYRTAVDGVTRCLPPVRERAYIDPACTQLVVRAGGGDCESQSPGTHACYTLEVEYQCGVDWRYHCAPIGPKVTDPEATLHNTKADGSGGCAPTNMLAVERGDYYLVGAELDASAFVASAGIELE